MTNFNNQMITWETAFAQYVEGLETKNIEMIDEALTAMKSIDLELTAKIWAEDMMTVREWRQLDHMVEQLVTKGMDNPRFKQPEAAQKFLSYVTDLGIAAKVKSYYGKWFAVELISE